MVYRLYLQHWAAYHGECLGEIVFRKKAEREENEGWKEGRKEGRRGRKDKRERGREKKSEQGREEGGKEEKKKETLIPLMFPDSKFSIFRKCARHFFP